MGEKKVRPKGCKSGNPQNLKPYRFGKGGRTPEAERAIRSKGGKANKNNPKSIIAARIREMKKKGLSTENAQFLHDMMSDSELAAFQIMKYVAKLMTNSDGSEKGMNSAAKTAIDWYKIKHGSAESNKTIKLDVTIMSEEDREKEIVRILGQDYIQ